MEKAGKPLVGIADRYGDFRGLKRMTQEGGDEAVKAPPCIQSCIQVGSGLVIIIS